MEAPAGELHVVGAAVVEDGRLLVVSKRAAPDVFYLPGGKPDDGEDELACLERELLEELSAAPVDVEFFETIVDTAALESVAMRMSVYLAGLDRAPEAAAEVAAVAWFESEETLDGRLAPAVRNQVVPRLREEGLL